MVQSDTIMRGQRDEYGFNEIESGMSLTTSGEGMDGESAKVDHERVRATPRYLTFAWILLLLIGAFYIFAPVSDLLADTKTGIPADHIGTFTNIAGTTWDAAKQTAAGTTKYVTTLEVAYAVHESVFGILFIVLVVIPFRQRQRWAWWACWVPMLANITYSLTFGRHDSTILYRSLIADIALPVLLLVHIPAFFGRERLP